MVTPRTGKLTGKTLRYNRLSRYGDDRFLFVPLDHSVADGPIVSAEGFNELIQSIIDGGADGIVVHKGRARVICPALLGRCSLVIHLSASTSHAPDANAKVLVGDVEEAVRIGADAVSAHVNLGSETESAQLSDLGTVAAECDRWGMPLIAMIYPRGPSIDDPTEPELLAHAVNIAADLGADIVKTMLAKPPDRMAEVVATSPLPVVIAGGGGSGSLSDFAETTMQVGCHGLAVGRRVFTSEQPRNATRQLAAIVHRRDNAVAPTLRPVLAGVR
jgi:2-amino-4,5-dihydroxy-6-oxo-7-(phosphonooxy)heptanoate synthase